MHDPVSFFLEQQGFLVLDGGLATEVEALGYDLNDALWSARVLLEAPDAFARVYQSYLGAGADCIASASYQATFAGLGRRGLGREAAADVLRTSVSLAVDARDAFWGDGGDHAERLKPLVAASVGPYGAFLADGSEYTGAYGIDADGLGAFHEERWKLLAESGADLLACETIPSIDEALVLADLLRRQPRAFAWFSFSCRNAAHISDGTPMRDVAAALAGNDQIVAVGVNCTAPRHVGALVRCVADHSGKPAVAYPNSGEQYDPVSKNWSGLSDPVDFGRESQLWFDAGARLIGGCCRTGPEHIRAIRRALAGKRG